MSELDQVDKDLIALFEDEDLSSDDVLNEIKTRYIVAYTNWAKLEIALDEAKTLKTQLEQQLSSILISKNLKSLKTDDGVTLTSVTKKEWYVKSDLKTEFLDDIRKIGDGDLIKSDVNWQTLQSTINLYESSVKKKNEGNATDIDIEMAAKFDTLEKYLDQKDKRQIKVTGIKTKLKTQR